MNSTDCDHASMYRPACFALNPPTMNPTSHTQANMPARLPKKTRAL